MTLEKGREMNSHHSTPHHASTGRYLGHRPVLVVFASLLAIAAALVLFPADALAQCNPGQKSCDGDYCIPSGDVCCGYGNGTYCDSAYPVCCGAGSGKCGATSADCGGGSGGGGGGNCPAGQKSCDGNYCIPAGEVCCGYGNGTYCDGAYPVCCGPGSSQCGATQSDCSGGPSTGSGSPGGPGGSSGDYYCSPAYGISSECDDVEACCNQSDCYYQANGRKFYCDGSSCYRAADELVDYCEDELGGCSISQPGLFRTSSTALGGLFALMLVRRLRRRRRRRRV